MQRWIASIAVAACLVAACIGCDDGAAAPKHATASAAPTSAPAAPVPSVIDADAADAPARTIAVLGDASRLELIAKLASAFGATVRSDAGGSIARVKAGGTTIDFVSAAGDGVTAQATVTGRADAALLVVDSTIGPTPIIREHALLARQTKVPAVVIVLSRSGGSGENQRFAAVDGVVREVVRLYFQPEDTPRTMLDDANAAADGLEVAARGVNAMAASLADTVAARPDRASAAPRKSARAVVYAVSRQEAFRRDVAATVDNGPATITFGGRPAAVEVKAGTPIAPAGNGEVMIMFHEPCPSSIGDHFVVLKDDHITAVGTIVAD